MTGVFSDDAAFMPSEPPKGHGDFFSIVVIGAMNPPIHHPLWYRHINAISEEEEKAAAEWHALVVISQFAQLRIHDINIVCQSDRWEINTRTESQRQRMLDIACAVFTRLDETPVSRFGLNTKVDRTTAVADVNGKLAGMLAGLGFGFDAARAKKCMIRYSVAEGDHSANIDITSSLSHQGAIAVAYNTEYEPKVSVGINFDLSAMFRARFDVDHRAALDAIERVVARING
jgi:hypothetical protein